MEQQARNFTARVNSVLAALSERAPGALMLAFVLVGGVAIAGMARLSVENRFIDYFHDSTEIHQGMLVIDRELGGTTPLDIILEPPQWFLEEQKELEEMDLPDLGGAG